MSTIKSITARLAGTSLTAANLEAEGKKLVTALEKLVGEKAQHNDPGSPGEWSWSKPFPIRMAAGYDEESEELFILVLVGKNEDEAFSITGVKNAAELVQKYKAKYH